MFSPRMLSRDLSALRVRVSNVLHVVSQNAPYATVDAVVLDEDIEACDALYVGGAGNISVVNQDDETVVLNAVAVGILPISVKKVNTTSTTATGLRVFAY